MIIEIYRPQMTQISQIKKSAQSAKSADKHVAK
jgi:hypothetical protein